MRPDPSVIQDDDKYQGPVPIIIPIGLYSQQGDVEISSDDRITIVYVVDNEGKNSEHTVYMHTSVINTLVLVVTAIGNKPLFSLETTGKSVVSRLTSCVS